MSEARHDAEQLLAELLGTDRGGLLLRRRETLDAEVARRFERWISRRERREPQQHILGTQEFYGLPFVVDRRVLVPRPETEGLVEAILEMRLPRGSRVADLGTGSGCIALALARLQPGLELLALDDSAPAIELARINAARLGLEPRVRFVCGPMEAAPADWRGIVDVVVSNPPYVREDEWPHLEPEVREYEPRRALVAGPTGLEGYRALAPAARELLRPGGRLVLELGWGQSDAVAAIVERCGFRVLEIRADLRKVPRVLVARARRGRRLD